MKCFNFELQITLSYHVSSDNLIALFTLYYTKDLINSIIRYINNLPKEAQDLISKKLEQISVQLGLVEHVEAIYNRYPQALKIDEILRLFDPAPLPSWHLVTFGDTDFSQYGISSEWRLERPATSLRESQLLLRRFVFDLLLSLGLSASYSWREPSRAVLEVPLDFSHTRSYT